MRIGQNGNGHERFEELCALSTSGSLTHEEQKALEEHLRRCAECRAEHERYLLLTQEGIPMLADRYAGQAEQDHQSESIDEASPIAVSSARAAERVLTRIACEHPLSSGRTGQALPLLSGPVLWRTIAKPLAGAVAASLLIAVSYCAYRFVQRTDDAAQAGTQAERRVESLEAEKKALASKVTEQIQSLIQLESKSSYAKQEIEQLHAQLRSQSKRDAAMTASLAAVATETKSRLEDQLRAAAHDREVLIARLHDVEASYQSAQAELVNLRAERDRATLRLASLESDNSALVAANRDQERRLKDAEQYLSSDRDIRELMGARQLYMADVFDVSSDSRTRKPYGRIFYTKTKSLIFYAFDLDRQPGVKNASFQAWGRNESSQGTPVNLGILYQDSEANRRWFLRLDDPKQLAEIDAVFVTIEPHGGSNKPTGKPFLYASLRREPNHP